MDWMALVDGPSAGIVLGGTALATVLRCGWRDCLASGLALAQLGQRRFDADRVRAELAVQVQEIRNEGLLRAPQHTYDDREFDDVTEALFGKRSVGALLAAHEAHRAKRLTASNRAIRCLAQAAELAPVFGLAGTLVSLSQLPADGIARGAIAGAISMAVVTTLYGLLLANLLFAPLSRMIERAALAEEAGRQQVIDWLAGQVEDSMPRPRRALEAA